MKRPSEPTEHAEQCVVMQWAALNAGKWPCLRLLHAVPNGAFFGGEMKALKGGKSVPVAAIRARKLKAEGLKEGVPDLCLPVPSFVVPASAGPGISEPPEGGTTNCHGIYIEMKRQKSGVSSPMQTWWRQCLIMMGYHAVLCHGAAEAIEVLRQHVQHAPKRPLPALPVAKPKGARALLPAAQKRRRVSAPRSKPRPFLLPPQYG